MRSPPSLTWLQAYLHSIPGCLRAMLREGGLYAAWHVCAQKNETVTSLDQLCSSQIGWNHRISCEAAVYVQQSSKRLRNNTWSQPIKMTMSLKHTVTWQGLYAPCASAVQDTHDPDHLCTIYTAPGKARSWKKALFAVTKAFHAAAN